MSINPPIRGSIGCKGAQRKRRLFRINPPIRGSIDKRIRHQKGVAEYQSPYKGFNSGHTV